MRPRKFALPQAGTGGYGIRPYVFCGGRSPRAEGGAPRGVFSLWSKTKSVGAHSICARGSLSCRKRARADMESAPTFFVAEPPHRGGAPRGVFSLWPKTTSVGAHSICARGSLSYRKRARADMESAPTFLKGRSPPRTEGPRGAVLPIVRASGFISACALSKTILCGILFLYKFTGKPGANRRRKAIGAHRVSQLPTRNCCFTAAGSFASFWGRS